MLKKNLLTLLLVVAIAASPLAIQAANFDETKQTAANQLEGKIYSLSEDTEYLPNFASMTSLEGSIYTTTLNIENRILTKASPVSPTVLNGLPWFIPVNLAFEIQANTTLP